MVYYGLWETLTEMIIGVADTVEVVVLAMVVTAAGFVAEDLLLEVDVAETEKCFQPFVLTAEKSARFLLNPQMASRSIAVIVLRKWAIEVVIPGDLMTGLPVLRKLKADLI